MERRIFLKNAAAISAFTILKPGIAFSSARNSAIQVGIIGCGSRGTEVISAMSRSTNTNIIAMADLFEDKLSEGKVRLDKLNNAKGFAEIKSPNIYQGSRAYLELLANKDVQAVLISSPCYTHPAFLDAAVAAGKHVYCEKPVAVDVEGCKKIEKSGDKANGKLSVVIGFQIRHASAYAEMVKRIQRGDIGEIINVQLYYFSSGIPVKPISNMSGDEARIRNHFHFHALSGGILLDQGIHMIDVCNWAIQKRPLLAIGNGGKKGAGNFGDTWNHYQVLYQYPENLNVSIHSTQLGPSFGDVCARFIGTKGMAEAHYGRGVFIEGENKWDSGILREAKELTAEQRAAGVFTSSLHDANDNKVRSFINSIESGRHLNETRAGAESTLSAILGREAAMNGKQMSWIELLASNQTIDPKLNLSQFDKR
ncbi:MAG: Gfo/Idh/MocA family oxidoreductase [Chitinophagaceae bacterium]|nr:Gfo/Idh/MocA family oxidoreductase [Chitinophagaceae bacterium]